VAPGDCSPSRSVVSKIRTRSIVALLFPPRGFRRSRLPFWPQKHESHERLDPPVALRWWVVFALHPRVRPGRAHKQEAAEKRLEVSSRCGHRPRGLSAGTWLVKTTVPIDASAGAAGTWRRRRLARRQRVITGADSA